MIYKKEFSMIVQLPSFLFTWDFWNTIIAIAALLISIYSVWYTRKQDKYKIEVIKATYDIDHDYPPYIHFVVFNSSNSSIKINKIEIFSTTGDNVKLLLNFIPPETTTQTTMSLPEISGLKMTYREHVVSELPDIVSEYYYSTPHTSPEIIAPNESSIYSYYIEELITELKVKVHTDKRINYFFKSKSFLINLVQSNYNN